MFWILKVPLSLKWSRSETASNLYLMLDENRQWLRFHESFWRGEAGKQSAGSGLLSIADKQVEIGIGRRNQIDKDPVKSRPEGGGGRGIPGHSSNSSRLGNSVVIQSTLSQQQGPRANIWQHPQPYRALPKPQIYQQVPGLAAKPLRVLWSLLLTSVDMAWCLCAPPCPSSFLPADGHPEIQKEERGSFLPGQREWGYGSWEAERSQPKYRESQPSHVASVGSVCETGQVPPPWMLLSFPAQPHCQLTITTCHIESVRTGIGHHLTLAGLKHHYQLPKARPSYHQLLHISEHLVS